MWGGGYGNRVPQSARDIAEAFWAGKYRRRTNCWTDGETYFLENNPIARRIDIPKRIAQELTDPNSVRMQPLGFSFNGWPTQMTARHLCALGISARVKGRRDTKAYMNDKPVDFYRWYTLEQIAALPEEVVKPKRVLKPRLVQMTPELPGLFEPCVF